MNDLWCHLVVYLFHPFFTYALVPANKSNIQKHIRTVHQGLKAERLYVCEQCYKNYPKYGQLRYHVRRVHEGKNIFQCPSCVKAFKENKYLQYHIETVHKGIKPFLCHMCEKSYGNVSNLNHHIKYAHEKHGIAKSVSCKQCHKIFNHKIALASHIKKVHQKIPCTFCGKSFEPVVRLKHHITSVHTEEHLKPFQCLACQKGFVTKLRLNDHMNIHTGNKPYICKFCQRGFADKGNQRMHEKTTHEGHKRRPCNKNVAEKIEWSIYTRYTFFVKSQHS